MQIQSRPQQYYYLLRKISVFCLCCFVAPGKALSGTLNALKRALMYRALRLFGNSAYESENTGEYAGAESFMEFGWYDR
jgi:hypothetical protein